MDLGRPARGLAFIKHIETEDTYRGGKILIPDQARDKIAKMQFTVVDVGEAEVCEEPDDCLRQHNLHVIPGTWKVKDDLFHPCDVKVGDWVICRNRSWSATPDPDLYVVRQSDVLGKFVEVTAPSPAPRKRRPQPAP